MRVPAGIRFFPFTALGLVTFALAMIVEHGNVAALGPFLRVLIIPMYAGWLLAHMIVHGAGRSHDLWMPFVYLCGFLPYAIADAILNARRAARRNREARSC